MRAQRITSCPQCVGAGVIRCGILGRKLKVGVTICPKCEGVGHILTGQFAELPEPILPNPRRIVRP